MHYFIRNEKRWYETAPQNDSKLEDADEKVAHGRRIDCHIDRGSLAQDVENGANVFKQCQACHSIGPGA
jgi:cytochrome c2